MCHTSSTAGLVGLVTEADFSKILEKIDGLVTLPLAWIRIGRRVIPSVEG